MATNREIKPASKTGNGPVSGPNGGGTHGLLDDIQQKVTSQVDERKNRAADGLGGIANVFRKAGNELRGENETVASYVDLASDQLRRLADEIRRRGVADMLDDVHDFARRRPALFIGGAFLIGFGIARFLKSSAVRPGNDVPGSAGSSDVDSMARQSMRSYGTGGFGEAGS